MVESDRINGQHGKPNADGQSLSSWLQDHACVATVIVLIASLLPRLFLTLSANPADLKFNDSGSYFRPAVNLLQNGKFVNKRQEPEVSRTPGYPVFLSAVMVVTGKSVNSDEDLRTILIVQTIITSWSVVFLYWLARRIVPPIMAFTGALLAAFSPWGAVTAGLALTEGLYLLTLALLFLVMYFVVEHTTKLSAILAGGACIGLLTSAVVFVRPLWPLVPIVAIALFLLCGDKRKKAWILVAVMLVCSVSPLYLWKTRNLREAQFYGLTDVLGVNAYHYFAAGVKAQLQGAKGDRWALHRAAQEEERQWSQGLSLQEVNDERWRRANAIFRADPILTAYCFVLNAGQYVIHPDPGILRPAGLNFRGDIWVLSGLWASLLIFAGLGLCGTPDRNRDGGVIQRKWLLAILGICLLLTLPSGITFGQGSRYRVPLELIVPLLAAIGLVRLIRRLRPN
jgi:4-amino-4-deoxy-L-arabinose transferase-like glycosyltransferase